MSDAVKTPEEYFLQQEFGSGAGTDLTEAEQAFLRRYAGLGLAREVPVQNPEAVMTPLAQSESSPQPAPPIKSPAASGAESEVSPKAAPKAASPAVASVQEQLRTAAETQLVSFFLSGQEYALPISMVQEVITFVEPTKLPAAPPYIAGIINLRGRVTPLVRLNDLLRLSARDTDRERFIVVCRHEGLQIGLIIHAVATMYRVRGEEVEWNIEARLGVGSSHLAGLLKFQEKLIGIIAVDQLVRTVLER
jgi:purine-binding chemotaxis protein CheW